MPKKTTAKKPDPKKKEIKISTKDITETVKNLMQGGGVERIIIKGPKGQTLLEIPVSPNEVKKLLAPVIAAVGAATALVKKCSIVVEKK